MGERKGTNKYYPPDFDPAKHGSLNKYHHSHPLRERARKLAQGILIIRFEMPYNIWCEGCESHIGMGVRYNAEKKKVGTYYTTPIYRFRMKCHLCPNHIELQTDPAGCDYVIVSGARRKEQRWDPADCQQVVPTEKEEKEKLQSDAMFRLEHGVADLAALQRAVPTLASLQQAQSAWKDDFGLNSRLRRHFREEKKLLREEEEEAAALQARAGLSIPLLREEEADRRLAALLKYHSPDSYEEKQRRKRSEISSRSWFPSAAASKAEETLRKLGLGSRALWGGGGGGPSSSSSNAPPAAASSSTPSSLGIVRRRSGDGQGDGGGEAEGQETPPRAPSPQIGGEGGGEGGGDASSAPRAHPPHPPGSLVADYSDSSSGAETP